MGGIIVVVNNVTGEQEYPSEYIDKYSPRDILSSYIGNYDNTNPLTVPRNVEDCRGYVYRAVPFPGTDLIIDPTNPALNGIAPKTQVDGVISVPPESILVAITCTSLDPAGFDFRIFDKSLQVDYFYGEWASNYMVGNYDTMTDALLSGTIDTALDHKIVGQNFLSTPILIVGSGELNVSLVNRSSNFNMCQFLLQFATPGSYSNVSLNAVDQSSLS